MPIYNTYRHTGIDTVTQTSQETYGHIYIYTHSQTHKDTLIHTHSHTCIGKERKIAILPESFCWRERPQQDHFRAGSRGKGQWIHTSLCLKPPCSLISKVSATIRHKNSFSRIVNTLMLNIHIDEKMHLNFKNLKM